MHCLPTAELDSSGIPRLRRILTVWDLAFYGLVSVTPSAPATGLDLAQLKSHGHAVDTILVAMVAMVLTAISYGRMAALYPSRVPLTPTWATDCILIWALYRGGQCCLTMWSARCSA